VASQQRCASARSKKTTPTAQMPSVRKPSSAVTPESVVKPDEAGVSKSLKRRRQENSVGPAGAHTVAPAVRSAVVPAAVPQHKKARRTLAASSPAASDFFPAPPPYEPPPSPYHYGILSSPFTRSVPPSPFEGDLLASPFPLMSPARCNSSLQLGREGSTESFGFEASWNSFPSVGCF